MEAFEKVQWECFYLSIKSHFYTRYAFSVRKKIQILITSMITPQKSIYSNKAKHKKIEIFPQEEPKSIDFVHVHC